MSALSDARAEQIVAYAHALAREGRPLVLDEHGYDCLRSAGFTRATADKAVNALVDAGRAVVNHEPYFGGTVRLVVRLVEGDQ